LLGFIRFRASDLGDEACYDLLAETIVKIERNIHKYQHRHDGSFHSWCMKIAQNTCISARRGKASQIPAAELLSFEDAEFLVAGNEIPAGPLDLTASSDSAEAPDQTEAEELFYEALATLNEVDQTVILLRYITPIPDVDIARRLEKPVDHIRKIRHKALKKLKRECDRLRARSPR
jgi:RNA polymerase sigma factor (sigma-70 family)